MSQPSEQPHGQEQQQTICTLRSSAGPKLTTSRLPYRASVVLTTLLVTCALCNFQWTRLGVTQNTKVFFFFFFLCVCVSRSCSTRNSQSWEQHIKRRLYLCPCPLMLSTFEVKALASCEPVGEKVFQTMLCCRQVAQTVQEHHKSAPHMHFKFPELLRCFSNNTRLSLTSSNRQHSQILGKHGAHRKHFPASAILKFPYSDVTCRATATLALDDTVVNKNKYQHVRWQLNTIFGSLCFVFVVSVMCQIGDWFLWVCKYGKSEIYITTLQTPHRLTPHTTDLSPLHSLSKSLPPW